MHKQSNKFWLCFVKKVCQRVEFMKCQPDASLSRFSEALCVWVPISNCFFSVFLTKKMISRKVHMKVQNCLPSRPGFEIWYQTTISMTYQVRKSEKNFIYFLYPPIQLSLSRLLEFSMKHLNSKGFYKLKRMFFVVPFLSDKSWSLYENASWQRNLSMYFLRKLFFLKTFFVWRIFLTTFYLTFCSHHFFKTHPSFSFAQRWFVKGSKVSSCRDLLGMNRGLNF